MLPLSDWWTIVQLPGGLQGLYFTMSTLPSDAAAGSWVNGVAQGNARVQYGHNYYQTSYATQSSGSKSQEPDLLVEALKFDHMSSRLDSIDPALSSTCRWIVDTPEYLDWREPACWDSHHGLLWITGKAGCGKSTSMKYVLEYTGENYHDNKVVSFFFNARGSTLEKTVEGMYRSLLWQMLAKAPKSVRDYFPKTPPKDTEQQGWPVPLLRN